jgi:outer membrane protein assembly factor BamD
MFKNVRLIIVCIALLTGILMTSCNSFKKILKGTDIHKKYAMATTLYEKGDYHRAMQLFDELLIYYRGTDTSEKINYYYAQCYFGDGDYLQAGFYFTKFSSTFPTSHYTEECRYMSAYCQYMYSPKYSLDQTITVDAIKEFQLFINMYPKSDKVAKCNELMDELRGKLERKAFEIAKLYYNIDNYESAVISFKNLLKDFPDTKYKEVTYYYILLSNYNYALKSYENKKMERLNNAKDAYSALITSFPNSNYEKDSKSVLKSIDKEIQKLTNNTIKNNPTDKNKNIKYNKQKS